MNICRLSIFLGVFLLALSSTHTAMADAAPPPPPPGTSLEPGESVTNVQMLWEDVIMTITDNNAAVQAVFRFQNQDAETESFDVRFPLGVSVQGPITDFSASVDGVPPGAHLNLARLIRLSVNAGCPGIWNYGCAYGEGPTTDLIPEALAAYRRALKITPNDADLYAEYLEFLISTTGYVEEITNELFPKLEYALTLNPDNERLITLCSGLEEIELWPPLTEGLTLSPAVERALGATGTPTYNQTPTPPRTSDIMGSMSTKPALVTPIASSSGGRVLAWLVVILILGLLFTGIAGAIIIVARKK